MIKIEIVFDPENADFQKRFMVGGPLEDKITCMGMIEMAKQVVVNYKKPVIETPSLLQVPFPRRS